MQEKENKIYKVLIDAMHIYFLGEWSNLSYDEKVTALRNHSVTYTSNSEVDEWYMHVRSSVISMLSDCGIEVDTDEIDALVLDVRIDLQPQIIIL